MRRLRRLVLVDVSFACAPWSTTIRLIVPRGVPGFFCASALLRFSAFCMDLIEVLQIIALSRGLGLLVGLQREHAESQVAGIRTFALITLAGTSAPMGLLRVSCCRL